MLNVLGALVAFAVAVGTGRVALGMLVSVDDPTSLPAEHDAVSLTLTALAYALGVFALVGVVTSVVALATCF